ncbi:MAG: hypothetical protein L6Q54_14920 [Leptospiraceae bacterium]|nr:hypothetical protein [Leptospiraceae bacterium]
MESGWEPFSFSLQPDKVKAGEILWERATLPVSSKEETLRFLSVDQLFQVYLDDTLLYHMGDPEHSDEMTTGNTLHLVRLPVIKNPSKLCFRLFSRTSNIGLNGKVSIGLGQNHLANLFKEEILKLIFSAIFFKFLSFV